MQPMNFEKEMSDDESSFEIVEDMGIDSDVEVETTSSIEKVAEGLQRVKDKIEEKGEKAPEVAEELQGVESEKKEEVKEEIAEDVAHLQEDENEKEQEEGVKEIAEDLHLQTEEAVKEEVVEKRQTEENLEEKCKKTIDLIKRKVDNFEGLQVHCQHRHIGQIDFTVSPMHIKMCIAFLVPFLFLMHNIFINGKHEAEQAARLVDVLASIKEYCQCK